MDGLGNFVYTVLKRYSEGVENCGLDLKQVTPYSDSHANSFLKFYGETATVSDWKSVFDSASVQESLKEDPTSQTMVQILRDTLDNKPASVEFPQLVNMASTYQLTIFKDSRVGEVFKYIFTYFTNFGRNKDLEHALPYLSYMMIEYSKLGGVPFFMLANLDPMDPFQTGMNMYWPLKFNLLMEPFKFSNQHEIQYHQDLPKQSITSELHYTLLMTGVRYFLCQRLQKYECIFTPEEFNYAMRHPRVRQNLFTYLGFALDSQSFGWEDRLTALSRTTLDTLLVEKGLLTGKGTYPQYITKTDVRVCVVRDFDQWIKANVDGLVLTLASDKVQRTTADVTTKLFGPAMAAQMQLQAVQPMQTLSIRAILPPKKELLGKRKGTRDEISENLDNQTRQSKRAKVTEIKVKEEEPDNDVVEKKADG